MNTKNKQSTNFPNLRFPGFEGEWERLRVSDLLEFFPTNSLSWGQLNYETENMQNLHYGLIHKGLAMHIDLYEHKLPNINTGFEPKTYSLCENGDIVFADASEDTNDIAKAVELYNCGNKKIVSGLHTIHGRDKLGKTVVGFKGYAFASSAFRSQIRQLAQGTKVFSISQKNFKECFIGVPSKDEQNRITKLLRVIETRNATQMKIIEETEKMMKGLQEQIFSQKLRFKNKNGGNFVEWKYLNFNKVFNTIPTKKHQINKVKYKEIGRFKIVDQSQNFIVGYSDDENKLFNNIPVIVFGDHTTNIKYIDFPFILGADGTKLLKENQNFNLRYLFYNLQYNNVKQDGYKRHFAILQDVNLEIPCLDEQFKIASFFSSIDKKLETERQLLTQYQNQKKHLLQNLFV